jgi:1,6-anhydro-N-acetylmuramate kinase
MTLEQRGWTAEPVVRVFAGVARGGRSGRLKTAILRCRGEGWSVRVLHTDAVTNPPVQGTPRDVSRSICRAVVGLAGDAGVPLSAIDVLGLADVVDDVVQLATEIAERIGVTVVTRFGERDKAVGGRGAPLSPAADWILLRSAKSTRLLVHLGPSIQVTLLEAGGSPEEVLAFDAGPGTDFLDALALRLSQGRYPFDPSGHFAVQGRQCEPLIEQWTSHPFLLKRPPRFLDPSEFDEAFVESSLTFAREQRLHAKDVLCSANHFVTRALRDAIRRLLPSSTAPVEVIACGSGIKNGFLWKLTREACEPTPVRRTDDLGAPGEVLPAVRAALLAYLAMENLPGNIPRLTGASAFRVLGTIVPGSSANWDRWVCNLADCFDGQVQRAA